MNDGIVVVVLAAAVAYGTPLLFAALGELLAERSGVLNLGVEGMMLVGAVSGFLCVQHVGGSAGVALPVAVGVGGAGGRGAPLVLAFLVITLRANQIVSGLALTIFAGAAGLSSYLGNDFQLADDPARFSFGQLDVLGLADLPIVGPIVFGQTWLVYASWVASSPSPSTWAARGPGSRCARWASRPPPPTRWGSPSRATATSTRSPAARSRGSAARASAWR